MTSDQDPGAFPDGDDAENLAALKSALTGATPRPDTAAKAAHLRLAQDNFAKMHAARQGTGADARLTSDRPTRGVFSGVRHMLNALSTKGGLTATTALAAIGFLVLTPQGKDILTRLPGLPGTTISETETRGDPTTPVVATPRADGTGPAFAPQSDVTTLRSPDPDTADIVTEMPGQAATPQAIAPEIDAPVVVAPGAPPAPSAGAAGEVPDTAVAETDSLADTDLAQAPAEPLAEMADTGAADAIAIAPAAGADMAPLPENLPAPVIERESAEGFAAAPVPAPLDGALDLASRTEFDDRQQIVAETTEAFANDAPNPIHIAANEPVSTFSIDVDTAAYAVVRQSLNAGQLPPADAVRIEEMINYFPYDYPAPSEGAIAEGGAPFLPTVTVLQTPWNPGTQLVHIGLQGAMPAIADRPPLNLVFLIDTSGSMEDPAKLPLLRQSFLMMLDNLRPDDEIAIVTYAGSAGIALAPTRAENRAAIADALNRLGAGGSTNGQGGLEQAYATARQMTDEGDVSRVILATDGDFNVGLSGVDELENFISKQRDTGVYLSVLGFGRGNLDDATMQTLAQNGNGTAAYIDTLNEAQKVLVDQLTGALFAIAGDVKVQVEFNPAVIAEYRLIGYETRALAREDFNNDRVDAGELGAGHAVTAIYEVTPVGSDAVLNDPLRYAPAAEAGSDADAGTGPVELGFLRLRWKAPGSDDSQLIETPIYAGLTDAPTADAAFATAIAGFGQLLRGDDHIGSWGWDDAIALAAANRGTDPFGYRTEAVQLMRLAQSLSAR